MKNDYKPFKMRWMSNWLYKSLLWIMAFGIAGGIVNAIIRHFLE